MPFYKRRGYENSGIWAGELTPAGNAGYVQSSEQALEGSFSGKLDYVAGANQYGGTHNSGESTPNGGEHWTRCYFYLAPGWQWNSTQIKVLRTQIYRSNDTPYGFCGVIWSGGVLLPNVEPGGSVNYPQNKNLPAHSFSATGVWTAIEFYTKLGIEPNGAIRMWVDGVLKAEYEGIATLGTQTGAYASGIVTVMGTWNSPGAPGVQTQFVDAFVQTNDPTQVLQVDAEGNKMIGLEGAPPPIPVSSALNQGIESLQEVRAGSISALESLGPPAPPIGRKIMVVR